MTSCLFELTLYLSAAIEKDFLLKLKIENVVTFLYCLTFMKNYFFLFISANLTLLRSLGFSINSFCNQCLYFSHIPCPNK